MTPVAPLFILGSPRSFTSVISTIIGQHPEAYGVPELNIFVTETLGQLVQRFQGFRQFQIHGLMRTVAQLYAGEQTRESIEMASRWINRRLDSTTAELYQELADHISPLRIVDKSPVYAARLESMYSMQQAFPDAYFLHLVRHPRTHGQSVMKLAQGMLAVLTNSIDYSTDPPVLDPQFSWYKTQRKIVTFLDTIPAHQQLQLRGEDVLNEPHIYLRQICEWAGLSWSEAALEAMLRPQDSPFACVGPYGAHLGNDINFLKSPDYRYRRIAPSHLDGPLEWRSDQKGFRPEVLEYSKTLGYE
ncbi:MAG: sulfotransferase [Leptolyngbyaceae cyanobacterium MAG.088]|nr:sulfotransferase [Leptolyngbyaceae cyanobacterium MAG.088]